MNTVNEKHERAMQWAEAAFVVRRKGHLAEARDLSSSAYDLKWSAAEELRDSLVSEPSRSVLFRSAATQTL
ncbi:MAG: hypothetical protein H7145_14715 [Akkermansiaceae bacterium]|nr:hypothetical protein [Armatimonadota bacterium]